MKRVLTILALSLLSLPALAQSQYEVIPSNDAPDPNAPLGYAVRNNQVITGSAVQFKPGTAILQPASDRSLRTIKKYLDDKSYVTRLRIEGHTVCGKGDQALSEARAKAVAGWLIKNGVDCKRLVATGFGCTKPIVADHAELNERIEFVNAALRGHQIGGMPADGGGKVVQVSCP